MATNSILANIKAENAVSEIILLLNEPKHKGKTFILLEGDADIKLFRKLLHEKTTLIRSYGSNTAIDKNLSQYFTKMKNVIGIRDKDYQNNKANSKIFYCDFCCAELMIVSNLECMQNIYCELYEGTKTPDALRLETLRALCLLSCARKASSLNDWKIRFDGIKPGKFYNENFDNMGNDIVNEINKQNPNNTIDNSRKNIIMELYATHQNLNDLLNITNGHDFINLLCELCRRIKRNLSIEICESALRLSFHKEHFSGTQLYEDLKSYERQNHLHIVV